MSKSMLTLDGKRFVVLPESEYKSLVRKAGGRRAAAKPRRPTPAVTDAGDVAESRRRLADPNRVSAADLFRRLGD